MPGIIKVKDHENQYGIKIMTFQPGIFNQGFGIHVEKELRNLADKELQKLKDKLKPNEHTAKNSTTEEDSVFCFNTIENIELICNKFHQVARQMRSRHNNRSTLNINDEYDVQDLFHSLLALYFDDIRREESNPSYAGANSRSDFLLKPEQTVIEIKKTRQGLNNKQLGKELTLDANQYQAHPDCKILVCFVYDPEGKINNPRGLEKDLEQATDNIEVKVFIRPL